MLWNFRQGKNSLKEAQPVRNNILVLLGIEACPRAEPETANWYSNEFKRMLKLSK